MTDLVRITDQTNLPTNPTASDTADWYRLGDAVEKHGRHMKRQAVAAEYNSGRNMAEWCRLIEQPERTMRDLLNEAKNLGLTSDVATSVSTALPTQAAAREYAKAEPEVKEIIKEIIREDPEAEIKAAEIKKLRLQIAAANAERDDLVRRVNAAEINNLREVVLDCGIISSAAGLLADLSAGMVDEYYDSRLQPAQQQRLLQTLGDIVSYAQAFIDRKSAIRISPQIIDV
jgi:hypothetical protein